MKIIFTYVLLLFLCVSINAQEEINVAELQAMYDAKSSEAAALQAEADAIKSKIDAIPGGWDFGGLGILGFDLSSNKSWYALDQAYAQQNSIGTSVTLFANMDKKKSFWNNDLTANIKKQNAKVHGDSINVESVTDDLAINSLGGYKISKKWALSAEGRYTSTVFNFNDPGKLTLSAGATWLPVKNMVVVIHPLGYEFNFPSGDFVSAPGAKIGATYNREIYKGVAWNSKLSLFMPYGGQQKTLDSGVDVDYSVGDLFNWTWVNGFGLSIWKGIGVGFNFGLRQDKQLADQYRVGSGAIDADIDNDLESNPLQFYYNLGLSYGF